MAIQGDLHKWHTGPFSWLGRIAILKMNVLPRLLYLFQAIPIKLPKSFFVTYKRICRAFIWSSKTPRLSWERLTLPKSQGGLNLPDIQKYHWACHLTRIVDWHLHGSNKDWIQLENAFSQIPVAHIPWLNPSSIPKDLKTHPLINATTLQFKNASSKLNFKPFRGPMTPLENNPDFQPDISSLPSLTDPPRRHIRVNQLFHNDRLLSHQAMTSQLPNYQIPFYKYLQIRHFLQHSNPNPQWSRDLSPFESICNSEEPQKHLISTVYALLFSSHKIKDDKLVKQWETDLRLDLSTEEWDRIYNYINKGTINVSTQESRFKIFTKWYRTPDKIHTFHPSISPLCWRCNASHGTLLHIWWECTLIQPFWTEIHRLISQITTITPDFTPAQFLLHHTTIPRSKYKNSLVLHLINAANQCIPVHWRSTSPPTISEWICRVDKTAEMENLIHQSRDKPTKYWEIWACWLHYKEKLTDSASKGISSPLLQSTT